MSQLAIAAEKVVSIHYTLKLNDGSEVDSSSGGDPLEYLHGAENIVPGLEKELEGKQAGDRVSAVVAPEEGYGERFDDGIHEIPRDELPSGLEPEVGQELLAEDEEGDTFPMQVVEIRADVVVVDLNHPLAGETLHFEVEVVAVRDAEAEELEHGHPHGTGCEHEE